MCEAPKDENVKIWRYLEFTKFVSLLNTQALFFSRADKLPDPFEGSYPRTNIELRPDYLSHIPKDKAVKLLTMFSTLSKEMRTFTFISCWHISNHESAAMWELYTHSAGGIAIQATFKRLRECFDTSPEDNVYISEVKYIDYDIERMPEGDILNALSPYVHKRTSFAYEHELRAIIQKEPPIINNKFDFSQAPFDLGKYVSVDLDILIEKIFVSPSAPEWFTALVHSVVDKYNLGKEVIQSSMSKDPVY